ncbi:dynein heavy chain 9, axonemal [Trichonephila clavipes]|nr:dynein heavy chain 9, axonemal [Trichonephila clavipes]
MRRFFFSLRWRHAGSLEAGQSQVDVVRWLQVVRKWSRGYRIDSKQVALSLGRSAKALSSLDEFQGLDRDMEASPKRWRKFLDSEFPEKEALPQEWKNRASSFHKLCIIRCLRPDRIVYAIRDFVAEILGPAFVNSRSNDLDDILNECGSKTPILFILSPGVDPLHDLEACGHKRGFTTALGNFQNVSLGQGQESIAEQTMDTGATNGHWVVLQNIHLAKTWLHRLEKKLEEINTLEVNDEYRLFLSANPPEEVAGIDTKLIPPGVLESCLKVTNEPPKGMQANLHKALDNFSQAYDKRTTTSQTAPV